MWNPEEELARLAKEANTTPEVLQSGKHRKSQYRVARILFTYKMLQAGYKPKYLKSFLPGLTRQSYHRYVEAAKQLKQRRLQHETRLHQPAAGGNSDDIPRTSQG